MFSESESGEKDAHGPAGAEAGRSLPAKAGPGHRVPPARSGRGRARRGPRGRPPAPVRRARSKALSEVEENKMHLRFAENRLRPLPTARPRRTWGGVWGVWGGGTRRPQRRENRRSREPQQRPPVPRRAGPGPRLPAGAAPGSGGRRAPSSPAASARQVLGAENWDFVGQLKTQTSHLARKDPTLNSPIRRRLRFLITVC